jgi:DNA polymerase
MSKSRSQPRLVGVRIDIETRSRTDIKFGAYRYCEDPDFEVLHIAYSPIREFSGGARALGKARLLDFGPMGEDTTSFRKLLNDPTKEKHAFNANFERIGLSRWDGLPNGQYLDPLNWHCSAIKANVNGIFGRLDDVASAVRSPIVKDNEGKRLIKLFSLPDRSAKGQGRFHEIYTTCWCGLDHYPDFLAFGEYCKNDVMTEAAVDHLLPPIPADVQAQYEADQRINDRGIRHFKALSQQAVAQVATEQARLMGVLKHQTGLDNPNSPVQMKAWLEAQGYPMLSLDKEHRAEALADPLIPDHVAAALELKGAASLSSVTKHQAALNTRCSDGRIRGSLQFYGAHTGREAGRGIQPQNLPKKGSTSAERALLLRGKAGRDAPEIAKGTVRSSLVPAKGHVFVTVDENAIEARVLGWLTGERWVQAEFAGAGKIYEATAATMFGIDKNQLVQALNNCGKCDACVHCKTRGRGKVSNLALGYGGAAGALVKMGAEDMGIDIGNYRDLNREWKASGTTKKFHEWRKDDHDYPELLQLRDLYRQASPETVRFWKLCGRAWDLAALEGKGARFGNNKVVTMLRDGKHNRIILPSGRSIWYRYARSVPDPKKPERIDLRIYTGKGKGRGHMRTGTHGGSLTENITQAVARDVLFDLIMRIEAQKNKPGRLVLHVHDEVVLEVPEKHADQRLADILGMMEIAPSWGTGLIVRGEGKIMERYAK